MRRSGMPCAVAVNEKPPAVLFDVDGTLVDSNYLHVHAWYRAFSNLRIPVQSWQIHRSIGMDGEKLLEALASEADEDARELLASGQVHVPLHGAVTVVLQPVFRGFEALDVGSEGEKRDRAAA